VHHISGRFAGGDAERGLKRLRQVTAFSLVWCVMAGAQQQPPATPQSTATTKNDTEKTVTNKDRRRATKLFLEATKLFQKEQYDAAMRHYDEAAKLDPENPNYAAASVVARTHKVTELIQQAAKARIRGDNPAERAALQKAAELDPRNIEVLEHLREMADDVAATQTKPLYGQGLDSLASAPELAPSPGKKSFHLRTSGRQEIQNVFQAFGIEAFLDSSVTVPFMRFDLEDATFAEAMQSINMVTNTFTVPLDAHRALVAKNTTQNRNQYQRQELETVYLGGLTSAEMTDIGNIAKNVFQAQQAEVHQSSGTLTIRATPDKLNAFNGTLQHLLDGHSQVLLDVRLIQLAHTNQRNTGVQPPQQTTIFNVYTEEQAILNQNQALVQQIIAAGLASPGDTLAILGILLASGVVSNPIFTNGFVLFGGGLTLSGLSPSPVTVHLNLNSSDSRELDQLQLNLADGEEGTLKAGSRYPITTSRYSNLGAAGVNIPGLTTPGASGGLNSLLAQLSAGAQQTIPQIQYEDLGLTFKATPRVIRNGDIALSMDMKITALAGSSLNGVPVINNRSYSGAVTVKEGSAVVLVSEVDKEESRALSGLPGLTEIPGLSSITHIDAQKNYATLLIVVTPHVIRETQPAGHTPMIRIARGQTP
jgi:Flp pilus assembly secretin CpaC